MFKLLSLKGFFAGKNTFSFSWGIRLVVSVSFFFSLAGGVQAKCLSGTYTIGGSGADYATFNAAVAALDSYGVCGAVVFNVSNGTYNEQVIISTITGSSSTNTITFQSASGDSSKVIITDTVDNIWEFNGSASYITLKQMTFISNIKESYNVIGFIGSTTNEIQILSNQIFGAYGYTAYGIALTQDSNLQVKNNFIKGSLVGVYQTGFTNARPNGIVVENNMIDSSTYYGVDLYCVNNAKIISNVILRSEYGIYLNFCNGATQILKNKVYGYGMGFYSVGPESLGSGINTTTIANNFFGSCDTSYTPMGMYLYYCAYQNIYFNNASGYGSSASTATPAIDMLAGYNSGMNYSHNNIMNNNFVCSYGPAFYNNDTANQFIDSMDYNNFYSKKGGVFAVYDSVSCSSISKLKSVSGRNAHSININPDYQTNLNVIATNKSLADKGGVIPGFTTDIYGNIRRTPPTTGANEIPGYMVAMFSAQDTNCAYSSVSFADNSFIDSCGSANKWLWSFGDGNTDTVQNPSHVYDSSGLFTVKLIVYTSGGCSDSVSKSILINPVPSANVGSNSMVCSDGSVSIGGTAVSGNRYSWASKPSGFGSTNSNATVSPTITTTYYLTETVIAGGCEKSDSVVITLNPRPNANAGSNSTICSGGSASLGSTAVSGDSYSWTSNPGGFTSTGSSSTVSPTVTTTYYLTESIIATGCNKSDSVIVTVNPLSNASFISSITGYTAKFSPADSTLFSYNWSFGDGATDTSVKPTHVYSVYGTYMVYLVVKNSNGCTSIDSMDIIIKSLAANFNVNDTNCAYTSVSFTDSSKSNSCGTINNWHWSFGDGDTGSSQNPSHIYTSPGVFTVKLTVSTSGGCTDSFAKKIFVDSTCVWPGDANDNKLVEITDLLNIGIAFNDSGSSRVAMNNAWKGQYCDNWGKTFITGGDYKHADCNGDGVVDSLDLMAVSINWGDTHRKTGLTSSGSPSDPPFYLNFSKTSYNPGDTVKAEIMLGNNTSSLTNIYGLASSFNFDLSYVDTNTLKVIFTKSWFGNPGTDMFSFIKPEYANGALFFAISRIDHKNTSGNGIVGNLSFVVPQNAGVSKSVNFTPGSAKLIAFNETTVPVYLPADTFSIDVTTGIENPVQANINLSVAPNPFTSTLSISYTLPQGQNVQLTLMDITGKQIATLANENQSVGQHIYTLDAGRYNMQAGIYFLRMVTGGETVEEKILNVK